jgi:hypothetical protein
MDSAAQAGYMQRHMIAVERLNPTLKINKLVSYQVKKKK